MDDDAVRRSVEVEAPPEDVWELIIDDDERAAWFGGPTVLDPAPGQPAHFTDPDGSWREAVVERVDEHRRLSWVWWPATEGDGPAPATCVDVELEPCTIGTRVTVTEAPLTPVARASVGGFPLLELEHLVLCRGLVVRA